jgi:hypothetical protein
MKTHKNYVVTLSSGYTQRPVIEVTTQKSCLHLWPGGVVKMINQVNMQITNFLGKVDMCMQASWTPPSCHIKKVSKKIIYLIMRARNRGDI